MAKVCPIDGCKAAFEISHAEVAIRATLLPMVSTPSATDSTMRSQ